MVRSLVRWFGPRRFAGLVALAVLALAAGAALQIAYAGADWLPAAQLALFWLVLAGLGVALWSRVPRAARGRVLLAFGPGLALVAAGVLAPDLGVFFGGAGLGWIAASYIVGRGPTSMTYQAAVRHLRRNELPQAIAVMDRLIEGQPGDAEHLRFRAELHRLNGSPERARRDYEQAVRLAPDAPAGYLGLAELYLQQGQLDRARAYAVQALDRDPASWQAAHTLGMIADRQGDAPAAIEALERAHRAGIPDAHYRLLAHLWLARAHARMGQGAAAAAQVEALRGQAGALKAWRVVLAGEQAAPLRALLDADLVLAQQLIDGAVTAGSLAGAERTDGRA